MQEDEGDEEDEDPDSRTEPKANGDEDMEHENESEEEWEQNHFNDPQGPERVYIWTVVLFSNFLILLSE